MDLTTAVGEHDGKLSLWAALLDLVAAKDCGWCGLMLRAGSPLCARCAGVLDGGVPGRAALGRGLGAPAPRVFAAGLYDEPVRAMLIRYKERERVDLAKPLGEALARA